MDGVRTTSVHPSSRGSARGSSLGSAMAPTACSIRATPSASASGRAAAALSAVVPGAGRASRIHEANAGCAPGWSRARSRPDAGGASSALNLLVGSGVLLGLGSAALRARPALSAGFQTRGPVDAPDSDDDDSGLRWGVAGFVSCLPLFGFAAWFLPAMGGEVAGSSRDPDDAARAQRRRSTCGGRLCTASRTPPGFDPADRGTWAVAAACAARAAREIGVEAERRSRAAAPEERPSKTMVPKRTGRTPVRSVPALDAPRRARCSTRLVETAVVKEREAAAEAGLEPEPEASAGG